MLFIVESRRASAGAREADADGERVGLGGGATTSPGSHSPVRPPDDARPRQLGRALLPVNLDHHHPLPPLPQAN